MDVVSCDKPLELLQYCLATVVCREAVERRFLDIGSLIRANLGVIDIN